MSADFIAPDADLARTSVYRRADLLKSLNPQSIAVIGASPRAGSIGAIVMRNLATFDGAVWAVNSKGEAVEGRPGFTSIAELPAVPDSVIIAVPSAAVEQVLKDCVARGVGGVAIFASGFSEMGTDEGKARQAELARIARAAGIPLMGPNTIGSANLMTGARMTFSSVAGEQAGGARKIGIVSQSGALAYSLVQATQRGLSISHVLAAGNSCDVDIVDLVAYLAEDPDCHAIACLFEALPAPLRFREAAERARAAGKAIVACKIASSDAGSFAAQSHSGLLAGSREAYLSLFEDCGVIPAEYEDLLETAAFFAKAPARPAADGVAVLATSGGAAIMAADKAELHDVPLPQPEDRVRIELEKRIPPFGSARNPCDVTAMVVKDPGSMQACAAAMMSDPSYGVLVVPSVAASLKAPIRAAELAEVAEKSGKFYCSVWLSGAVEGTGSSDIERMPNAAIFRSMDRCFATLAAWQARAAAADAPPPDHPDIPSDAAATAAAIIADTPGTIVGERRAKSALAAYGLPMVPDALVQDAAAARDAAASIGFPVVMKVDSADIPHKTDAGVVRLSLKDADAVAAAFDAVMANALRVTTRDRIDGVLIQPMIPEGTEMMIGGRVDPLMGPMVIVGAGGIAVEILKDSATALCPVDRRRAKALIARLKSAKLLEGFRGRPAADIDRLADTISRFSHFLADQAALLAEADVNPVICSGDQVIAVDALLVKQPPEG